MGIELNSMQRSVPQSDHCLKDLSFFLSFYYSSAKAKSRPGMVAVCTHETRAFTPVNSEIQIPVLIFPLKDGSPN